MENKLEMIYSVLKKDKRLVSNDGILLKNEVISHSNQMDKTLLNILFEDEITKNIFFSKIGENYIFDKIEFNWIIESSEFLPDTYTKFSNKIQLVDINRRSIIKNNDVVLEFPNKDCILEFDSTDKNVDRKETFYNEILAKDSIDVLLDSKVFSNVEKHTKDGNLSITDYCDKDNFLIKGNNLLTMYSLLPKYKGKIKLMYWDILYNTDSDKVPYNDSFKHSSWLTMLKNRLEVAKKLLNDEGTIYLQCDDKEMAYLKVLCDNIFDRSNYINTITIKTKIAGVSGSSEGKSLVDATEFILIYAKNKEYFYLNQIKGGIPLTDYVEQYKIEGKSWKYTNILIDKGTRQELFYDSEKNYRYFGYTNTVIKSVKQIMKSQNLTQEEVYNKYYKSIFRDTNAQSSVRKNVELATSSIPNEFVGLEYVPIKGKNKDKIIEILYKGQSRQMVTMLSEMINLIDGIPTYMQKPSTIWTDIEYNNLKKEGNVELSFGKKPEKLMKRIIQLSSNEGDIVLDAYIGTGTTAAVAHKLNRRYIGIEQLNEHYEKALLRLENVINGDNTGISKDVKWTGGGTFVSFELANWNNELINTIINAENEDFSSIFDELSRSDFITYKIDIKAMIKNKNEFLILDRNEKIRILLNLLDKNLLYVNYSEIDDTTFNINSNDKSFTNSFYKWGI